MDAAGVEACEGWLFYVAVRSCRRAAASFLAADYFGIEPEPPKFAEKSRKLDFGAAVHHDAHAGGNRSRGRRLVANTELEPQHAAPFGNSLVRYGASRLRAAEAKPEGPASLRAGEKADAAD